VNAHLRTRAALGLIGAIASLPLLCSLPLSHAEPAPSVIPLWPRGAPGAERRKYLSQLGVAAFAPKYRLPGDTNSTRAASCPT
jgi:hypothetical protein